ncbi:hypothetical protein ACFL96_18520 [Thermoproteota archaeon]
MNNKTAYGLSVFSGLGSGCCTYLAAEDLSHFVMVKQAALNSALLQNPELSDRVIELANSAAYDMAGKDLLSGFVSASIAGIAATIAIYTAITAAKAEGETK